MSTKLYKFKDDVIKVCPEAKQYYDELEVKLKEETECRNCVINKTLKPIWEIIKDKVDVLPKQLYKESRRTPCMECVYKHIAKAYILLNETQMGYDHVHLAKINLIKAMKDSNDSVRSVISSAVAKLKEIEKPTESDKILTVINILKGSLEASGKKRYYLIIGNMSEAEEECDDIAVKNTIRVLRKQYEDQGILEVNDLEDILMQLKDE